MNNGRKKRTTIGQYYNAESIIHRLDPRVKFIWTFVYIITLFFIDSIWMYVVPFTVLAIGYKLSKVPFKYAFRGLKGVVVILIMTVVLDIIFTPGHVLWNIWKISITREGIDIGCSMGLRLIFLVTGSSLMTYTTTPNELAKALESIMKPLTYVKVPVHDVATAITIALRFIPVFSDETDRLIEAQKARGADFESGNIFVRLKKLIPLIVPLFISAIKRSNELAMAMDARCYNSGNKRTQLRPLKYQNRDFIFYAIMMGYVAIMVAL